MEEFSLYTRILAPHYQANNQEILIEEKENHKAVLVHKGIEAYMLYRFDVDSDEVDFLPFFNRTDSDADFFPGLSGLRKFCDYILLALKKGKTFVLLIEMKSGNPHGAEMQLNAAETFMEFIRMSAERVKDNNNYSDFDSNNVVVKRIVVKYVPKNRPTTNISLSKRLFLERENNHLVLRDDVFPMQKICDYN